MDAGARVLVDGVWPGTMRRTVTGTMYVELDTGYAVSLPAGRLTVLDTNGSAP